jgi:hypothetical protein
MELRLTVEIPGTGFKFITVWMKDEVAKNMVEMLDNINNVAALRLPGENNRVLSMTKPMIDKCVFLIDEREPDETP